MKRRWLPVAAVLFAIEAAAAPHPPPAIAEGIDLFAGKIFGAVAGLGRLPVDLAKPLLIRMTIRRFVGDLPLPPDVRRRVEAKIDSPELVDEIVPFLMALEDQYRAQPVSPSFDDVMRQRRSSLAAVPGIEHERFRFAVASEDKADSPPDPRLAAGLVRFYDAVYLIAEPPPYQLGKAADAATIQRVQPVVRDVLKSIASSMPAGSENREGLERILATPSDVEAVSASLIEVVRRKVADAYRQFASRATRARDLERWAKAELERKGGGELWRYLQLERSRRRAVHVVVDGLAGRLTSELVRGAPGSSYLRYLLSESQRLASAPPAGVASRPAPRAATSFLESLVATGYDSPTYLPVFRRLLGDGHGAISSQGLSTTPTISVRNLPLVMTGAPVAGPGGTGIPNFHFVDRPTDRAYYFYGNDALALDVLAAEQGMRSMFDRLTGQLTLSGNAQYDRFASLGFDGFVNLALGEGHRDFGERLLAEELDRRAQAETRLDRVRARLLGYEKLLAGKNPLLAPRRALARAACRKLIHELAEQHDDGLPAYLLVYDPWPDHFSHFDGPLANSITSPTGELARLDYWLGRIERAYRAAAVYERTLFGMAGDHGLAPALHLVDPEGVVFDALAREGRPLRLRKISSDEGEGPKLTNPLAPPSMRELDLVVASTAGGNYMIDVFSTDDAIWARQPVLAELAAFRSRGGATLDLIGELLVRLGESLDYLVVRELPPTASAATTVVLGMRGGERREARVERQVHRYRYLSDGDLLDVRALAPFVALTPLESSLRGELLARCVDRGEWCDEAEWRRLTASTLRPDSVVQIAHLYDSDRAGSINLFAAPGCAFNSLVPGRHAGESYEEKDAFVGFWGEPVQGKLGPTLGGSVPATLFEWLTGRRPQVGIEGWGHPSVLGEILGASPRP